MSTPTSLAFPYQEERGGGRFEQGILTCVIAQKRGGNKCSRKACSHEGALALGLDSSAGGLLFEKLLGFSTSHQIELFLRSDSHLLGLLGPYGSLESQQACVHGEANLYNCLAQAIQHEVGQLEIKIQNSVDLCYCFCFQPGYFVVLQWHSVPFKGLIKY